LSIRHHLTREQIGTALEYNNPMIAIGKIHAKHKNRLDKYSVLTKLVNTYDGKAYDTYFYTTKGVMEICRWSRQPKADAFMDFTWDVMDRLLHKQPVNDIFQNHINDELLWLKSEVQSLKYNLTRQLPVKKYSRWKGKANQKIKLLSQYFGETSLTVLRNIYIELEDTYDISLNDYKDEYCFINGNENCSMLDVVESNNDLKKMFDCLIDSLLEKYDLQSETVGEKRKTIFN
jgi:hypothetical protein